MIKIAIDAGHGSQTAGKRTPDGYREHTINVKCAYYCEQALQRCGFSTVRIGWDDTDGTNDSDMSLTNRQKAIKNAKCNASVSFHANAYGTDWNNANGVETFFHSTSSKAGNSPKLAKLVQNRLLEGTKQTNRGVKSSALAMCNCAAMGTDASVLVEVGFMTNKTEAELMKTDSFCKEQGEEVAKALCDYYNALYLIDIGADDKSINEGDFKPYLVKITTSTLNVRSGPNTSFDVVATVKKNQKYTIIDERFVNGTTWLKLKSGIGWISSKYTEKI